MFGKSLSGFQKSILDVAKKRILIGFEIAKDIKTAERKGFTTVFDSGKIARSCLPLSFGQFGAMTQVQFFSTFIPLLRSSILVVVVVHCILF